MSDAEQVVSESSPVVEASSAPAGSPAEEAVQDAIDAGASPAEVKSMMRELKLKVNGKEMTKKIDLMDEKALIRELQLAEAGKGAMQKSKEMEKFLEQELRRLKEKPWEVLEELGHDPYAMSESKLAEWVENQKKSPEQVQFEGMQKELQEAREKAKSLEKEREELKFSQLKNQAEVQITKEIEEALSSNPNLPKSRKTTARITDALLWAYDNGFPEATIASVIPMVEADIRKENQEFFEGMTDELFEQYLGQKNTERLRKRRLAQAKQVPSNEVPSTSRSAQPKTAADKIKAKDFFRDPMKYQK